MNKAVFFFSLMLIQCSTTYLSATDFEERICYRAQPYARAGNVSTIPDNVLGMSKQLTEEKKIVNNETLFLKLSDMPNTVNNFFDRYSTSMDFLFNSSISDIPGIGAVYKAYSGYIKIIILTSTCYGLSRMKPIRVFVTKIKDKLQGIIKKDKKIKVP